MLKNVAADVISVANGALFNGRSTLGEVASHVIHVDLGHSSFFRSIQRTT